MYCCKKCKEIFDEPDVYNESHGFDYPPYEKIEICPYCGNDDFTETIRCDGCDEYITGIYIKLSSGKCFCEECFTKEEI